MYIALACIILTFTTNTLILGYSKLNLKGIYELSMHALFHGLPPHSLTDD